jgi:hypothetical protein
MTAETTPVIPARTPEALQPNSTEDARMAAGRLHLYTSTKK